MNLILSVLFLGIMVELMAGYSECKLDFDNVSSFSFSFSGVITEVLKRYSVMTSRLRVIKGAATLSTSLLKCLNASSSALTILEFDYLSFQ
jgi:hypothetical protein